MHPMLSMAIKATRRAATIIMNGSYDMELNKVEVHRKGVNDYVTAIDYAAEQAVIEVLQDAYPEHSILSEESGLIGPADAEYQWVLDPLDGTRNFIHGIPCYAVSLALMHKGTVIHAVIYDPTRNEMFTASRGGGAFLNDVRIRVRPRLHLKEAILAGRGFALVDDRPEKPLLQQLVRRVGAYRQLGSTVLEFAYLAAGRIDAVCTTTVEKWDTAAGSLLVLEAGGLIGDFQGNQNWLETKQVIAANPRIFSQMVNVLNTPVA